MVFLEGAIFSNQSLEIQRARLRSCVQHRRPRPSSGQGGLEESMRTWPDREQEREREM